MKREKLLEAAGILFAEIGFEKSSIRQIAGRVRTSSGMIYYYFSSKEDLFHQVLQERLEKYQIQMESFRSAHDGRKNRLKACTEFHFEQLLSDTAFLRLIMSELILKSTSCSAEIVGNFLDKRLLLFREMLAGSINIGEATELNIGGISQVLYSFPIIYLMRNDSQSSSFVFCPADVKTIINEFMLFVKNET